MDWEKNMNPHYKETCFRPPVLCGNSDKTHIEKWISYANDYIGVKELTIMPGQMSADVYFVSEQAAKGRCH
jgi:hypothetical protein